MCVDKWMQNRWYLPCHCIGYHFMHRPGSRYCYVRADGTRRQMGDPDWHDPQEDR